MNFAIVILVLAILVVLAWNFYPPLRKKLKGYSTIAEGLLGTLMTYFGVFADAIKEAQDSGYLPENIMQYAPLIIFAWIIIKRVQTKTPVGGK